MTGHLDTSVEELVEVLAELPGGGGQLAAGASGGLDHVACRLVQVCSRLVQLSLSLLERLGGRRNLKKDRKPSMHHSALLDVHWLVKETTHRFSQQLLAGLSDALQRQVHVLLARKTVDTVVQGVRHGFGHLVDREVQVRRFCRASGSRSLFTHFAL